MTMSGHSYLGSTGILRPGTRVELEANVTGDPARALANAWRMADTRGGIRHVYEVGDVGEGLVVLGDLPWGSIAWEALGDHGCPLTTAWPGHRMVPPRADDPVAVVLPRLRIWVEDATE